MSPKDFPSDINDFLRWKVLPGFGDDLKKRPRLKCWAIETRPIRIGARIRQVSHVVMNMAGFGGEIRGYLKHGVKDYGSKGHRRVISLRLGVIFIERDITILEAHQTDHDPNHLMGHAGRWGSLKDSVLTQHPGLML